MRHARYKEGYVGIKKKKLVNYLRSYEKLSIYAINSF